MRVDYTSGLRTYSEWVCLEHEGFAARKATEWWRRRGDLPLPETVDEAIERARAGELLEPDKIILDVTEKYPRIVNWLGLAAREAGSEAARAEDGGQGEFALTPPAVGHELRAPCDGCGGTRGRVEMKAGQQVARCDACGRFAYCVPRSELDLGGVA
jgi:hypothetical protein